MRHDLTFCRQSSGPVCLSLARLALRSRSVLAMCSMALRAPLQGRHIQRGHVIVPVFVIKPIGRGGPQPKTQLIPSSELTVERGEACPGVAGQRGACGF